MNLAPSEEYSLLCDVPGCTASLSMVSGVAREEHGWGRLSRYVGCTVVDYDLCAEHNTAVQEVLHV